MPSICMIIGSRTCSKLGFCRECFFCVNKWQCESGKKPELNLLNGFLHPGSLVNCFLKKTLQSIRETVK